MATYIYIEYISSFFSHPLFRAKKSRRGLVDSEAADPLRVARRSLERGATSAEGAVEESTGDHRAIVS